MSFLAHKKYFYMYFHDITLILLYSSSMRELSKKLKAKGSKKIMSIRDLFLKHLKVVKTSLNEGVDILRKVPSIRGKIKFDLPAFASDIDFEVCAFHYRYRVNSLSKNFCTIE